MTFSIAFPQSQSFWANHSANYRFANSENSSCLYGIFCYLGAVRLKGEKISLVVMDGETHPWESKSFDSSHVACRGTGTGGGSSTRNEQRVLLEGEGFTAICLHLVTDESYRQFGGVTRRPSWQEAVASGGRWLDASRACCVG